jgi:N-acetylmuramic acid 6-phosphate etherase
VLTDTTERSPTYCTPPFRKFDDSKATSSWAFLFVPYDETRKAWESILKRAPQCITWTEAEVRSLVEAEKVSTTLETIRKISAAELMRFKIGLDGLQYRALGKGDCAIAIVSGGEKESLLSPTGFYRLQLESARAAGADIGSLCIGTVHELQEIDNSIQTWATDCARVFVPVPKTDLLLDGVTRVGLKMLLNSLSTCTMVRLGRVMGNFMIWVVPSNLKLIDRATRYVQKLVDLDYRTANELLFEVIEYVEPRMKTDQAYPPVVGVSVMRARNGMGNEEAEQQLLNGDW